MRKPRIAFFMDSWRPGSGSENQLHGIINRLCPDQIDARFYTLREPLANEYRSRFPCPVECLGIGSLVSPGSAWAFPSIVSRLRRERFDIAMIFFVDSNLFLVPACRLAGIPAIVINRRDMGYWYEPGLLRKLNFVNRWATDFLVNAEAVKQQVISHERFAEDRIHVIVNGMWDDGHRQVKENMTVADPPAGLPAGALLVGVTAGLREVKRLDLFLEAAARVAQEVPAARFVVAGQGRLRPALEEQATDLGLADRVVFLGQVADVPALLARLDVGVLTSESEGLSNSLVEYGLAGLPAVTFDVGGNPEVVVEDETGFLVPAEDVGAMAERIVRLLRNDEMRRSMGAAARDHCMQTFDPERIAGLTLDYFRSLMSRRVEAP